MTRRSFLQSSLALGASLAPTISAAPTTQTEPEGFFTLDHRQDRWWLITPEGARFFSIGLNHIDPATLRYPENIHIWRDKYGGSTTKWIKESVAPNLKRWGFNTVGWVQEVTVRKWRHSRAFTDDEYRSLEMPFCHLLPFIESHQWEQHTRHFDFRSQQWEEWADYVARSHCAELSEDRNLMGYFYSDCPTWVHSRPDNAWRGPIFDPDRLQTSAGRRELSDLARQYYKTTHDAIRRHDPHHLILGDRYEANAPLPMEIVEAALPYVDVLSFQDFRDPIPHLDEWHRTTGKPVLLADAAGLLPIDESGFVPNNGKWYAEVLAGLFRNSGLHRLSSVRSLPAQQGPPQRLARRNGKARSSQHQADTGCHRESRAPDRQRVLKGGQRAAPASLIVPEPQEYALVFALFALGFVFFHRHRQKKRQSSVR